MLCLLLAFGFLALIIELHAPGTFIGAGIAVLFFALFFWAGVYVGTCGFYEIAMFLIGILFLAIELLVVPGFGLIGIIGLILLGYGIFASFFPGLSPIGAFSPFDSYLFGLGRAGQALAVLVSTMTLMFTGTIVIGKLLPEMPLLRRLIHSDTGKKSDFQSLHDKGELLIGKLGTAVVDLRPAGKIEIDEKVYDAQSQGEFIEKGKKVKVLSTGFSLIVEEV